MTTIQFLGATSTVTGSKHPVHAAGKQTCNTIAHESNAIDVSGPLAEAVHNLLAVHPAAPASGSPP